MNISTLTYYINGNIDICQNLEKLPFPLQSFLCSILLSSLTYLYLISGCECSYWHFMLYLNLLSRRHLASLLQASTGGPF